jgi:hypothetical protein
MQFIFDPINDIASLRLTSLSCLGKAMIGVLKNHLLLQFMLIELGREAGNIRHQRVSIVIMRIL